MESRIQYHSEAAGSLAAGAEKAYEILKHTIGPYGRNVLLDKGFCVQLITNDGFHIIKDMELENPFENEGVQILKQAAVKTHQRAGDGSTTAALLAAKMIMEGRRAVEAGSNPVLVRKGMLETAEEVMEKIKGMAIETDTEQQILMIAEAAAGSKEIGEIIWKAFQNTGENAVITVEETVDNRTMIEITSGIRFEKGYVSPYFANNKDRLLVNFTDAYLLITDMQISAFRDILPLLEKIRDTGKPLLIIAEDVTGDALSNLIANSIRGVISVSAVRAPGYGAETYELLEDIAVFSGGRYFSAEKGDRLSEVTTADLGMAASVRIASDGTMISNGKGDAAEIEERLRMLFARLEKEEDGFARIRLQRRIASLSEKAVIIKVGAASQAEAKELKKRYEDALSAVYAAADEGIVYGAASAYIHAADLLEKEHFFAGMHPDERQGALILKNALEIPLYHIVENAGENGMTAVDAVKKAEIGYGYDVNEGKLVDLKEKEIYEALKVVLTALADAVHTAAAVLGCEVVAIKEKSPAFTGDEIAGEGFEPTTPRV